MMIGTFNDPYGLHPHLKGKTALLRDWDSDEYILAQFNDLSVREAYGWYPFPRTSFTVDTPVDRPDDPWENAPSQVATDTIPISYENFRRIIEMPKWTGELKVTGKAPELGMGYPPPEGKTCTCKTPDYRWFEHKKAFLCDGCFAPEGYHTARYRKG